MNFEEILSTTMYSTKDTVNRMLSTFEVNGYLEKIYQRTEFEIKKLMEKYPNIPDLETAINIMRIELSSYAKRIVIAIKKDYGDFIPLERIKILENLLNENNIVIINDPLDEHDFSADSEKGQVIVNLSKLKSDKDIYHKIVSAKGSLPHEIFHILIKMLKSRQLADDRMVIHMSNGEIITSRGMVGFILNEGFVEKISWEFCEQHEKSGDDFYHTIALQYIPYVNVCNYIMSKNPNINIQNLFSINFEYCLLGLTEKERKQYFEAECISYAVRHKKQNAKDIIETKIQKVKLDKDTLLSSEILEEGYESIGMCKR